MSEENTAIKKKSKKVLIVALTILAATVIIVIAVLAVRSGNPERRLKKQLELGERYLSELNYEQAMAAYRVAIEIDPKSVDAYLGLAVAYVGMDEYEEAVKALKEGYEITKDAIILESMADTYIKWAESVLAGGNEDKTAIARAIEILNEGYNYTGNERLAERIAQLEKSLEPPVSEELVPDPIAQQQNEHELELKEWLETAEIQFIADEIVLGESDISEAKAYYSGRDDYMSNLMNDDTVDTVYSMPYLEDDSQYDSMTFGYMFSAPASGEPIDSIAITDSDIVCLGGIRVGDSYDVALRSLGLDVILDNEVNELEVQNGDRSLTVYNSGVSISIANKYVSIYGDEEGNVHSIFMGLMRQEE